MYAMRCCSDSEPCRAASSAHGPRAVEGLANDVGVTSMLGSLGNDVQEDTPGRAGCALGEPRRLRKRVGSIQVWQGLDKLIRLPGNLLVLLEDAGQRLPFHHAESVQPLLRGHAFE